MALWRVGDPPVLFGIKRAILGLAPCRRVARIALVLKDERLNPP
jgi:hypothetical protein